MRLSEFRRAVADEFGQGYGQVLLHDLVLAELGGRTPEAALAAGVRAKDVWLVGAGLTLLTQGITSAAKSGVKSSKRALRKASPLPR